MKNPVCDWSAEFPSKRHKVDGISMLRPRPRRQTERVDGSYAHFALTYAARMLSLPRTPRCETGRAVPLEQPQIGRIIQPSIVAQPHVFGRFPVQNRPKPPRPPAFERD